MNLEILKGKSVIPIKYETGKIENQRLIFQPSANLISESESNVYGISALVTFGDISTLYDKPIFGIKYHPIPVLFTNRQNETRLNLCFVAEVKSSKQPEEGYISLIITEAIKHDFPETYVKFLRSFLK